MATSEGNPAEVPHGIKLSNPFGPQADVEQGKEPEPNDITTRFTGPRLSFAAAPSRKDSTRQSIQFNVASSKDTLRKESVAKPSAHLLNRRMSSPPPPMTYKRGVSFDTFDNRDASDFSLTLNYKHKNYLNTRRSRTFLCGTDQKDYSEFALEWLIDELVDDGDEIVCLRVVEKDSKLASDASVDQGKYREEAQKLLDQVIAKNSHEEKSISLVMELAVGKVQDIIQRMIQIYEPAVLVVGTRGRSLNGMQGLLPGSVSKYCLQQSPIPVIVVRPSTKRMKKKKKRLADPSRRDYTQIMSMSEAYGGHVLDKSIRHDLPQPSPSATEQEATAVAEALGLLGDQEKQGDEEKAAILPQAELSDAASGHESPGPSRPTTPETEEVVLKSPTLGPAESPVISGESEIEDDESAEEPERLSTQPGNAVGAMVDEVIPKSPSSDFGSGERPANRQAENIE